MWKPIRAWNSNAKCKLTVTVLDIFLCLPLVFGKINSQMYTVNYYDSEPSNELVNFVTDFETNQIGSSQTDDTISTTPEMIEEAGYPAESHTVTTEDGYILTMHRIPHGRVNATDHPKPKRVAFLQHGMFGTSADWVLNSVEKSLAYMLAEEGYDVWLGNSRGNQYSLKHIKYSPKFFRFWKFSWHQMGYYDLPAELDYILKSTNQSDLYYIGHSMGTTMFFVLTTTRPEYNSKIRIMSALGPAVYLNGTTSSIRYFAEHWGRAEKIILDTIGGGALFPSYINKLIHWFAPETCTPTLEIDKLCDWVIALIAGHDPAQTNYTQLPIILAHEPSTVSSHTAFHYFQNIRSGGFRKYDPGFHTDNPPPEYDLSKVTTPIALYWGPNDSLCVPDDVARFSRQLPNLVRNFRVNFTEFNHVDFLFAKDADILLNIPLIKHIQKY